MMARVALVVIARDEAALIERLLHSMAPWVDEMLVLDTGSADDTAQRARACGARVANFAWCDDFAAARNAALSLAAADWHLVLDADEWLIDGGPALQALRSCTPDFVGSVDLVDQFGGCAAGTAHHRLSRVLPGHLRYAGCVHEQPQHALVVRPLPVSIGHDGYMPERMRAKQGRNRRLLEQALALDPHDSYLWYQLGKDASVYDDHVLADSAFGRAAALLPARHGWWLDLMLDWAAEQPASADELLALAEHAWRCCLALGERPDLPGAVVGRGSVLAAHNLSLVLEATGRATEALALRQAYAARSPG